MLRDSIVIEIQRRLLLIKSANGYSFDLRYVFRNPEDDPNPDLMACTHLFEFPEVTIEKTQSRGAKDKPAYKKEMRVVMEHWYKSASKGATTRDINTYLKAARKILFIDGQTLGRLASFVMEDEVSRVYRPSIGNNVVGIGQVLLLQYIEDFATF